MVVYIDILFLLNLFVNTFLLLAAARLNGVSVRFLRLFFGAALGAAFSVFIFLPVIHFIPSLLIKLAFSAVIVFTAFGYHGTKGFLRLFSAFYAASFIFAGIMLALWFCVRPSGMAVNNGVVYFDISPLVLIASTLLCHFILIAVKRIFRLNMIKNDTYRIEIGFKENAVTLTALMDTGHTLVDILSGVPVVVAAYAAVESLLPEASRPSFMSITCEPPEILGDRYRLIPYSVVGGAGLLPAFRPDYVRITVHKEVKTVRRVLVAVSKEPVSHRFSALFGSELISQGEVSHEFAVIKK